MTATAKGERRRHALVAAAAELLHEGGFDAVRHRAVADRAGLPLASTTYYFASLDDLVTAAVEQDARDDLARGRAQLDALTADERGAGALVELVLDLLLGPASAAEGLPAVLLRYERLVGAGRRPYLAPLMRSLRVELDALLTEILARWNVIPSEAIPSAIRNSMACPAWPTCGLAVAESERVMPTLIREITVLQRDAGLADSRISYRMTGCPNGCARPYLGDVGFVGTTLGKYDVFLGGDTEGTRLNELYARNVKLEEIPELLRGPLMEYARTRVGDEGFGDWCARQGIADLADRHAMSEVSA